MKKIAIVLILFFLILSCWQTKTAKAEVRLYFGEGQLSSAYIKFASDFKSQFGPRAKRYPFSKDYKIVVLENVAFIKHGEIFVKELVIRFFINESKEPFGQVMVKDLETDEQIKAKMKEFSDRIFQRLLQMEKEK